jgi:hypothetical protein
MGKIKVNGNAERLYDPDMFVLTLTVSERGDSVSEASDYMREDVESLLAELGKLGITSEYIKLEEDTVEERRRTYSNEEEISYISRRRLSISMVSDVEIVNAVRRIIADEKTDITMELEFKVSNIEDIRKQLLREAVEDAKAKALLIADAMDQKLVGIESADAGDSRYDIYEETEVADMDGMLAEPRGFSMKERSDDLKAKQIRISSEIDMVWLIG